MFRKVGKSELIGKTIVEVDCEAVNMITLHFADGTKLELEGYLGPYNEIACIGVYNAK